MPLIELSAITGPLAKMGVDKAFTNLKRKEAVIKVRAQLKLPSEPEAGNFQSIYNHALVEWGMFKPEPVLDFFRDEYIYEAFRQSFTTGDTAILADEAENAVQRAEAAHEHEVKPAERAGLFERDLVRWRFDHAQDRRVASLG